MRKKLASVVLLALTLTVACGGEGRGDDDEGGRLQYCECACSKLGMCVGVSPSSVSSCANTCADKTEELGRSAESCRNAQRSVEAMTCAQLEQALGLRMFRLEMSDDEVSGEMGGGLGEMSSLTQAGDPELGD